MNLIKPVFVCALAAGIVGAGLVSGGLVAASVANGTAPVVRPIPAPAAAADHSPTRVVVVRPVTAAGKPAPGYQAVTLHGALPSIDCSFASPSPGAVDRNIEECSPSAAYAIACWKASKAHHALCLENPTSHRLIKERTTGRFAKTPIASPPGRAPLRIVLDDGTYCSIRDGGAWSTLKGHPNWAGSYSCSKHGVVWAPPKLKHYGIDESAGSWTVHTGSASGNGKLTVRHIERAYFVGTAAS